MLGSTAEADDAVQEAWLRLQHTGSTGADNLSGWLTTVVGRVCLDMLRRRSARREEPLELHRSDPRGGPDPAAAAGRGHPAASAALSVPRPPTPPGRPRPL